MAQGAEHNNMDRNDYSTTASQTAQDNFNKAASALEQALDRQNRSVQKLMAAYEADGVSEKHRGNEQKWNKAGQDVRDVIKAIRTSLETSDGHAATAQSKAQAATDL